MNDENSECDRELLPVRVKFEMGTRAVRGVLGDGKGPGQKGRSLELRTSHVGRVGERLEKTAINGEIGGASEMEAWCETCHYHYALWLIEERYCHWYPDNYRFNSLSKREVSTTRA